MGINNAGQIAGNFAVEYVENQQGSYAGGYLFTAGFLFTTAADDVNFNALTTLQQDLIAAGNDIYHGQGGDDVVTLPSLANFNESVGSATLGWTNTAASTFYTQSQLGYTYQVNGSDGNYFIVAGAGSDAVTITGDGSSTITEGSGSDTVTITGNGNNTISAGSGTAAISISGTGSNTVVGNLSGSVAIAGGGVLEIEGNFSGLGVPSKAFDHTVIVTARQAAQT